MKNACLTHSVWLFTLLTKLWKCESWIVVKATHLLRVFSPSARDPSYHCFSYLSSLSLATDFDPTCFLLFLLDLISFGLLSAWFSFRTSEFLSANMRNWCDMDERIDRENFKLIWEKIWQELGHSACKIKDSKPLFKIILTKLGKEKWTKN